MRSSSLLSGCIAALVAAVTVTAEAAPTDAHYARGTQNVFWFVHITDVHIGSPLYGDHDEHAEYALNHVVDVVNPWFVLGTGDLVDGAKGGIPTFGQTQKEWDDYTAIYEGAGMTPDFYFDLPGNHDGYGDEGMGFYLANSLLGKTHDRLYTAWIVEIPAGKYLFFGLNSAGNGSPIMFEEPEFTADEIEELEQTLQLHSDARLTMLAAHHHLGAPSESGQVISALESVGGGFYFHGHRHEHAQYLAGNGTIVVNELDSLAQRESYNIGVAVVDHDAVTYRATGTTGTWPHIMVTAPAGIDLFSGEANPFAYEVCKDRVDNPVRALVFSDEPPTEVTAQIGTSPAAVMTPSVSSSSLWTADVDTTGLSAGVHDVTVTATVGGETSFHKIRATFVDGPCDPLPEDPPPPVPDAGVPDATPEGGTGGSAGAGGGTAGFGGSAGGGAGGSGGSGGSGGGSGATGGSPPDPDAGVAGVAGQAGPSADPAGDDGGCACAHAGRDGTGREGLLALLSAVGLLLTRRRRSMSRQ